PARSRPGSPTWPPRPEGVAGCDGAGAHDRAAAPLPGSCSVLPVTCRARGQDCQALTGPAAGIAGRLAPPRGRGATPPPGAGAGAAVASGTAPLHPSSDEPFRPAGSGRRLELLFRLARSRGLRREARTRPAVAHPVQRPPERSAAEPHPQLALDLLQHEPDGPLRRVVAVVGRLLLEQGPQPLPVRRRQARRAAGARPVGQALGHRVAAVAVDPVVDALARRAESARGLRDRLALRQHQQGADPLPVVAVRGRGGGFHQRVALLEVQRELHWVLPCVGATLPWTYTPL